MAELKTGKEELVIETFATGSLECNCSLIYGKESRSALVVDPGDDVEQILKIILDRRLVVSSLIHTHAHFDHIGAAAELKRRIGALIFLHSKDLSLYEGLEVQGQYFNIPVSPPGKVDVFLHDGYEIELEGKSLLSTIHSPGHTLGSCCFYTELAGSPLLFSGDTLFYRSIGRTDLPGGDFGTLIKSIKERLFKLPLSTHVIPGHGKPTSLVDEKQFNPYL